MVIATSNGPCLRVSHGSVPVSANAASARLPASCAAFAKMIGAERAGRQEHDLPVGQMRRERARDVVLRGRGRRAEDQFGIAHGLGDVGRDQRRLRLVPPAKILHRDGAARRVVRLDGLGVAPPQPHVVAGERHVARRRERAVAAAEDRDAHQVRSSSRSTKCCTLPIALRGSASTNTYSRGTLKRASCASRCASSARASHVAPARRTT